MRLLITEKPFIAGILLQENDLITPDTEIVFTYGFGLWRYALPKISFPDIPFTDTPSELRPHNFTFSRYLVTASGETLFSLTQESTPQDRAAMMDSLLQYLRKRINDYEEIICAVDPDRTGYGAARQLLEQINPGMAAPVPVHCLYLQALDERCVRAAWEARALNQWGPNSRAQSLADTQLAKQTFDYWWNANSSVVFSELCHWVNVKADPLISKYELMLIAVIADTPSISFEKLFTAMQDWQGTGKYARTGLHGAIGSPTSRQAILDSAIDRGLVSVSGGEKTNSQSFRPTPAGDAFMSRLHPRTYDPDLPFRLEQWITSGDYASMRMYINTVFSRQLRYQRSQLKC